MSKGFCRVFQRATIKADSAVSVPVARRASKSAVRMSWLFKGLLFGLIEFKKGFIDFTRTFLQRRYQFFNRVFKDPIQDGEGFHGDFTRFCNGL